MTSVFRNERLAAGLLAGGLVFAQAAPAHALLGFDVDASVAGGFLTSGTATSLPIDADAYVALPLLAKAALHTTMVGNQRAIEATARFEPLPLPLIGLRPGIGIMQQNIVGTSGLAAYAGLGLHVGIPLLPVSIDAEVGAGMRTDGLVTTYGVAGNFFPLPLLPIGITAKVRQYQAGPEQFSAALAGLRLSL